MAIVVSSKSNLIFIFLAQDCIKLESGPFRIRFLDYLDKILKF
jgi:hypothetical protein